MQAAALRKMFETVLPAEAIREAVVRLGVQKRRRSLDPVALIYSLILQGGTWECGRIATAVRTLPRQYRNWPTRPLSTCRYSAST